jgi:soluble lytic murein transglycosylase-like protein
MRWLHSLCVLGLLCQCTTQHETKEFPPFFRTDPPGYLSPAYVYERTDLESRTDLSVREWKRLQDLYELEVKQLSRETPRAMALQERIAELNSKTDKLSAQIDRVKNRIVEWGPRAVAPTSVAFSDSEFKQSYYQVYKLWNRDEYPAALEQAKTLLSKPSIEDRLSTPEKLKALSLQFRIALDTQELGFAEAVYLQMVDLEDCETSTTEAGFLLALTLFAKGDVAKANAFYESQCDRDQSPGNLLKRKYWSARLSATQGTETQESFRAIAASGIPGYYFFLSHLRLGQPIVWKSPAVYSYRSKPLTVSSFVKQRLVDAEELLKVGLRFDAAVYLREATQEIASGAGENELSALLYLAHLFQAAGAHLDAMKIYSFVNELALGLSTPPDFDFLAELFPMPHSTLVQRVAEDWSVEPEFLYAIMRQESAFNPNAVSQANAHGLMQLMPFLAAQIASAWKYDPYFSKRTLFWADENVKLAAYHINQIQAQMPHPALMAAAYNAGAKRAANWWRRGSTYPLDVFVELIPINETRNYVKLVLRNYVFYKLRRNAYRFSPQSIDMNMPSLSLP